MSNIIKEQLKKNVLKDIENIENDIQVILGFQSGLSKMLSEINSKLSVIEYKQHNNSSSLSEIKDCRKEIDTIKKYVEEFIGGRLS